MCKGKCLVETDVVFTVIVEQDDTTVRGNAMVSGDDKADEEYEDEILARLGNGDVWAWAQVTVEARYAGLVGRDYLGACCYADEADFCKPDGYYDDMKVSALADLQRQIDELAPAICEASA